MGILYLMVYRKLRIKRTAMLIMSLFWLLICSNSEANIKSKSVSYLSTPEKAITFYQKALRNKNYEILWKSMTEVDRYFFNNDYQKYAKAAFETTAGGRFLAKANLTNIKYMTDKRAYCEIDARDLDKIKGVFIENFGSAKFHYFPYLVKEGGQWKITNTVRYFQKANYDINLLNMAIQNYYKSNNRLPIRLSDLVHPTAYLSEIPIDVFNDARKPYVYRVVNDKSWLLYSFGPDGDDDSGLFEYNPFSAETSNGDIVYSLSPFTIITDSYLVDYSEEIIKFILICQDAGKKGDYKILWDSVTKEYQQIFNNEYDGFKKWHFERSMNEPHIDNIFFNSNLRRITYINNNRAWVDFYKSGDKIQELDPTTRGSYLIKENNAWKFGSLAKYIRIKIKNDMDVLTAAIKHYYQVYNRFPRELSDLLSPVAYISKVPLDVFSDDNQPYIYRVIDEKSWMLYSIGPDSHDDLGVVEYDIKNDPISKGDIIIKGRIE